MASFFRCLKRVYFSNILFFVVFASIFYLLGTKKSCQSAIQRLGDQRNEENAVRSMVVNVTRITPTEPTRGPCVPLVTATKATNVEAAELGGKYAQDMAEEREIAAFAIQPWAVKKRNHLKNCTATELAIVHFVKSAVGNQDRRNAIRETWGAIKAHGSFRNDLVFVVALSKDKNVTKDVRRESEKFGDILQLNQADGANSVPEKVLAGMQWASGNLKESDLYTSVDDDMLVHIPNLIKHIEGTYVPSQLPHNALPCYEDLPIICTYSYQDKDIPSRDAKSKWYMPKEWYPNDTWPCYCRGGMYVAPVKTVRGLFKASRRTARLYLDDVWVTGFMRRKLGKGDSNIVPAPYSLRNDNQLQNEDVAPDDVIVRHMWGNIKEKPVEVGTMLRERYKGWKAKMNFDRTCV